MRELLTLISLEARSLYGINRFFHTKDKKEKRNAWLMLAVMILVVLLAFVYVSGLVVGLHLMQLSLLTVPYLVVLASILILVFGLFKAGSTLFGRRGYDLLSSMPLQRHKILFSRFFCLYLEDLAFALLIFLPGFSVYGFLCRPGALFWLLLLPTVLLVPLIPLVLSAFFGTLILALSSRIKHKNLLQILLSFLLLGGVMLLFTGLDSVPEEAGSELFASLSQSMAALFSKLYPPSFWILDALNGVSLWGWLAFATLSLGITLLFVILASRLFHPIVTGLAAVSSGKSFRLPAMESRSLLGALYRREARRYFASPVYVMNTAIGPLFGLAFAVALLVGKESVSSFLPPQLPLALAAPFLLSAVFSMMPPSSVSLSMEGRWIWIVQSLPVPAKALYQSKLLFNLSLMLPFYLLSELFLILALRPGIPEALFLILIPALLMTLSVLWGLAVDLKFHRLDWTKEEQPVKQSLSSGLGGFGGFLFSLLFAAPVLLLPPAFRLFSCCAVCLVALALGILLYRRLLCYQTDRL